MEKKITAMADHTTSDTGHTQDPGYETSDATSGPLFQGIIFTAVLVIMSFFGMLIMFKFFDYYQPFLDEPASPMAETRQVPPGPRLQVDPPQQKQELRAIEDSLLTTHGYGWADREARVARIPIERAMDLLAGGAFSVGLQRSQ